MDLALAVTAVEIAYDKLNFFFSYSASKIKS
jgi:hypothetical protein